MERETAMKILKELHGKSLFAERTALETLIPELKESVDERIKKELIFYLGDMPEDTELRNGVTNRDVLVWLEKQGEQKPIMNVPTREVILSIWDLGNEWKELTNGSISTEYGTQLDYIQKHWYESEYYLREKQGEQKPILDFKASNWYVSKVDGKIHDMTYNPTDKVEPKFKIGDYVVSDYCMGRVIEITNDAYLLDAGQGISFLCEDNMHLWTIADAKEGDILAGKIDGDNYILIFKTIKDGWIETYGHYYNAVNRFCVPSQLFCRSYQGTFTPATKEQRDLLFTKMEEAGYEFDFEKKELKKIENEIEIPFGAKDSELQEETYYIPKGFHAEVDDDKVVIKKGEKSAAWSEEDENYLQSAENACEYQYGKNTSTILWLKHLKDRIGG